MAESGKSRSAFLSIRSSLRPSSSSAAVKLRGMEIVYHKTLIYRTVAAQIIGIKLGDWRVRAVAKQLEEPVLGAPNRLSHQVKSNLER